MLVAPSEARVYVLDTIRANLTGYPGSYLFELDAATLTPLRSVKVPGYAYYLAYSQASGSVYVAGQVEFSESQGQVARVDLTTFTVAQTQPFNYNPLGVAVTPDGTEVLVTGSLTGTQIFDGSTLAVVGNINGGLQNSIVIGPR